MSKRRRVPPPCLWYDVLIVDMRAEILARLDCITRRAFAIVNKAELAWLRGTCLRDPLDYYEQLSELLLSPLATRNFLRHWLRYAPINRLQLWLCLRPTALAHVALRFLSDSQIIACWSACIEQLPYADGEDKAQSAFYQHTATLLLRYFPTSVGDYMATHRGYRGVRVNGLANPRAYTSPAALLFLHALTPRYSLEESESSRESSAGYVDLQEEDASSNADDT